MNSGSRGDGVPPPKTTRFHTGTSGKLGKIPSRRRRTRDLITSLDENWLREHLTGLCLWTLGPSRSLPYNELRCHGIGSSILNHPLRILHPEDSPDAIREIASKDGSIAVMTG